MKFNIMNISEIREEYVTKQKNIYLSRAHLSSFNELSWKQGWDAAIRFSKKMEKFDAFCTHCGKPLMLEECNFRGEDTIFCNSCNGIKKIE